MVENITSEQEASEENGKEIKEDITKDGSIADEKPEILPESGTEDKGITLKRKVGRPKKPQNGDALPKSKRGRSKKSENGDSREEKTSAEGKETAGGHEVDEDDDSDEELIGALERPLVVEGKRQRKSVDVYIVKEKDKKQQIFTDSGGKGVKLGDIPIVKHNIFHADTEDLHILHQMMYRRKGKPKYVKRNILDFSGWPFIRNSHEYKIARFNIIDRLVPKALTWTLDLLGLDISQDDEALRDMLSEFLLEPLQNDKEVPTKKQSKGVSSRKSNTPKGKRGRPKKSVDAEDGAATSKVDGLESEDSEGGTLQQKQGRPKKSQVEKDKTSKENENEGSDTVKAKRGRPKKSLGSEEEVTLKRKKGRPKKSVDSGNSSPTKKKRKATLIKLPIPTKKKIKSMATMSSGDSSDEDEPLVKRSESSDESSSDDEPLVKGSVDTSIDAESPPTDDKLKKDISELLKDADLAKVTMKTVIEDIFAKYSSHDLSSRREFIKETLREMVS